MCPIFVIKFSGVSDLQGVKVPVFPLTLLVIVTTVLRYRTACDSATVYLSISNIMESISYIQATFRYSLSLEATSVHPKGEKNCKEGKGEKPGWEQGKKREGRKTER